MSGARRGAAKILEIEVETSFSRGILRIACIDKDSKSRLGLKDLVESAFSNCGEGSSNFASVIPYVASLEEILLSSPPECVVLGPTQGVEQAVQTCRKIKTAFPGVGIVVVVEEEHFSLRTLRRFQSLADSTISSSDGQIRLVHAISTLAQQRKSLREGKVIFVTGAKGGVGATSVVSGLAHASESLGDSAVVIDLSAQGAFTQFISSQRWHSPDYAAALSDNISFDDRLLDKLLTKAPNGINLMLSPSGGSEVRELWLRDPSKFEGTLALVDLLRERFDYIIIDHSGAEGILPFSLAAAADSICVVTANEPASAHLLNSRLSELVSLPGEQNLQILINQLESKQLTSADVVDFLYANENFNSYMCLARPFEFDVRARSWVGTGNSFYTESSENTQRSLEELLGVLSLSVSEAEEKAAQPGRSLFSGLKRWASYFIPRKNKEISAPKALPFIPDEPVDTKVSEESKNDSGLESSLQASKTYHDSEDEVEKISSLGTESTQQAEPLMQGEHGSEEVLRKSEKLDFSVEKARASQSGSGVFVNDCIFEPAKEVQTEKVD